jgi:SAM-dependent methyltransferase
MPTPRLYADLAWVWPFLSPPEDYEEEVATFRARFARHGVPDGGTVLHLGSGGGSIDYHLKRHYRVTGVDLSPAMLAHARGVNPEVEYLPGDIRDVRLGRTFDAVLLHDASAYLTTLPELRAAYETAAAHLAPGGVLVTPPEELRDRFEQHHVRSQTHAAGDISVTTVQVSFDPDPADTSFEETYVFLIRQGGRLTVETDTHLTALYHLDEVVAALRDAGFDPEVEHWELSDWPPGTYYPIVTARKRDKE